MSAVLQDGPAAATRAAPVVFATATDAAAAAAIATTASAGMMPLFMYRSSLVARSVLRLTSAPRFGCHGRRRHERVPRARPETVTVVLVTCQQRRAGRRRYVASASTQPAVSRNCRKRTAM